MEYSYLPAELPTRIWKEYEQYSGDKQVSMLICAMWALTVVPAERIDFLKHTTTHPALDTQTTSAASNILQSWKTQSSKIAHTFSGGEGLHDHADRSKLNPIGSLGWLNDLGNSTTPVPHLTFEDLFFVARHGLSHGNVWTTSKHRLIDKIFIANFPPSNNSARILVIQHDNLYAVLEKVNSWYSDLSQIHGSSAALSSQATGSVSP